MTRNIIAEFSCSLDSSGNFKKYEVVTGSVFNDVYNEELDSASIVLAHIGLENRLVNLKQYDFVRVFDERGGLDKVYLVDSFNEREDRITEPRMFSYTIKLMSQTKLLEKIQCPSLTITHEVKDGKIEKKTIFEKICEYMELYVPKVKMYDGNGGWDYQPIIEIPGIEVDKGETKEYIKDNFKSLNQDSTQPGSITFSSFIGKEFTNITAKTNIQGVEIINIVFNSSNGLFSFIIHSTKKITTETTLVVTFEFFDGSKIFTFKQGYEDFYNKFNVSTADLGSSFFTLRQLLTMLMQQVGCIPTVENLKLSYLDFNKIEEEFSVDETINHVDIGASSDSYANTLVNTASNVLDSGNEVISEKLGFRDTSNVLLRQQDNLTLETKFPIYKINSFIMNAPVMNLISNQFFIERLSNQGNGEYDLIVSARLEGKNVIIETTGTGTSYSTRDDYIDYEVSFFKEDENHNLIENAHDKENNVHIDSTHPVTVYGLYSSTTHFFAKIHYHWNFIGFNDSYFVLSDQNFTMNVSFDITELVKETQERNTLETNFKLLTNEVNSLNELSKILYGTVGYSIGSNKIFGFSDYYSQLKGHLFKYQYGETYIETIFEWCLDHNITSNYFENLRKTMKFDSLEPEYADSLRKELPNLKYLKTGEQRERDNLIKFTQFTFDIKYQPLNSFNLAYVKKEESIDFPLEQLNSSESGLTDFDRLSINQQETVDRIGNRTLSISQRILPEQFSTKLHPIPSVYSRDGIENVIFKRTYTVGNYKYDVSYVGSKDAILKNYFTSIRTKYRAYQYVDYNQSVLRKEKDIIYVRIGLDYFDGDDKIYFENIGNISGEGLKGFLTGISHEHTIEALKYVCEKGKNKELNSETIKNDISLISNEDSFAIIYEQPDNISAGPYIANSTYKTYYEDGPLEGEKLGGVPQKWQEWDGESYNSQHQVYFTNNLMFFETLNGTRAQGNINYLEGFLSSVSKLPILTSETSKIASGSNVMHVVSDNKNYLRGRKFYKDNSERLNHTVQFIYYSDSDNVKWTENFIANNSFIQNILSAKPNAIYSTDNMLLDKNEHRKPLNDTQIGSYLDFSDYFELGNNYIKVKWNGYDYLKICHFGIKDGEQKVSDFIVFKRPGGNPTETNFYVTLNDTKTDYVMNVKNGILYRAYKVKTNTLNREVKNL